MVTVVHYRAMVLITTETFDIWLRRLRDKHASARIKARLRRIEIENIGDIKPVGDGVSELRIHCGPGYRIYLMKRGIEVVILLCGGDKSSQRKDIEKAQLMAKKIRETENET